MKSTPGQPSARSSMLQLRWVLRDYAMSRTSVTRFTAAPLLLLLVLCFCASLCGSAPAALSAAPPPNLRPPLQSKHYLIYTDVPEELAADLATRMDAMYDEYSRRLADFVADREIPR